MTTLSREPLARHTTFRIGGPAETLMIPHSEEELVDTIRRCRQMKIPYRLLGNGSNVLVREEGVAGVVIKNTMACLTLTQSGAHEITVGASVKLQSFIKFCVQQNLEGLEYLYSVPATIGGAVFMNAGRGRRHHMQIGDHIEHVKLFDGEQIRTVPRSTCGFGYRTSVFQTHRDWVILGAVFRLPSQPHAIGEQKVRERMDYIKESQDLTHPCAGSVFRNGSPMMFEWLKGRRAGHAQFSTKSRNWIKNLGSATADDVLELVQHAQFLHSLIHVQAQLELEVW